MPSHAPSADFNPAAVVERLAGTWRYRIRPENAGIVRGFRLEANSLFLGGEEIRWDGTRVPLEDTPGWFRWALAAELTP